MTQSAIATLARAFWALCVFRTGPQHLPRSGLLLALAALLNLGMSIVINSLQLAVPAAILVAVLEFGVMLSLPSALLFAFNRPRRLLQTLTALMGSGAVIGATALALLLLFHGLPQLVRVAIFLWNLLVMAHILRHALDVHLLAGFIMAVGYAMVLIQLIGLFGRALAGA